MGKIDFTLSVGDVFPAGTELEAHPRLGLDTLERPPVSSRHAAAKVAKDGTVTFHGLVANGPYFACGHGSQHQLQRQSGQSKPAKVFRAIRFNATDHSLMPSEGTARNSQAEAALQAQREREAQAAVYEGQPALAGSGASQIPQREIITGARNSVNARPKTQEEQNPPPGSTIHSVDSPVSDASTADRQQDRKARSVTRAEHGEPQRTERKPARRASRSRAKSSARKPRAKSAAKK